MNNLQNVSKLTYPLKILFVEDDIGFLEETTELFSMFFHHIDQALNGLDALKHFEQNTYDIIITDLNMPHMDGIELIKKVKQKNPDQIFIVLSAHTDNDKLFALIEVGISSFLLKPINQQQLLNTLHKVADQIASKKIEEQYDLEQIKLLNIRSNIDIISEQWFTPLNTIKMRTQLLKESKYNVVDNLSEYIQDYSFKQIQSTNQLIEMLSEFRVFFTHQNEIQNESLEKTIYYVLKLFKQRIKKNNINLQLKIDSSIFINLNVIDLKNIIINLILNSIEAFETNTITNKLIKISTKNTHNTTYLYIEDNAGGIDQNILEHIFQKNYSTKEDHLGLGLYLSKKILAQMDADIALLSKDTCTSITITFDQKKVHKYLI